ncbi:serine/threonine phosphatase [Thermosynechococcus sp. GLH187]|uniref:serine/threonine phosphatase n=1 Tax=unclassified Thermosynechococcus TaxID=2622553 RepID=UPI00287781C2|nr:MULTISPECIES: serine/threonine phosphatase [unclassified Thermosynechococcus]WNC44546.1 serine/threonine phosphatase [Thermosynechococcus sp. GLH187]WNC47082.1 serine/threonine phosphatase [Thermosynechococcus sp. GLH333]WNC49619.1 serine/threonine phosphatase [Thermosynechococcus sp. GLH87]
MPTAQTDQNLKLWWGVLYPAYTDHPILAVSNRNSEGTVFEQDTNPPNAAAFFDPQHRYQRWDHRYACDLPQLVQDLQPEEPTLLEALRETAQDWAQGLNILDPSVVIPHLQAQYPDLSAVAIAYLALHLVYPETIPAIHDAWLDTVSTSNLPANYCHGIILDYDHTARPLQDVWQDDNISDEQIFQYLEDMIELWKTLEPWHCHYSLLTVRNLAVNPDDQLRLHQLDFTFPLVKTFERPTPPPSLITVWEELFRHASSRRQAVFMPLLVSLSTAPLEKISEIQMLLDSLASTLRSEPLPDFEEETGESTGDLINELPDITLSSESPEEDHTAIEDAPTALLPRQLVQVDVAAQTDTGRDRHHNEDFYLIDHRQQVRLTPQGQQLDVQGLYVLCDGMGGHAEGEIASSLATKTVHEYFEQTWPWQGELPSAEEVRNAIYRANEVIFATNDQKGKTGSGRMGTTLVMALLHNYHLRLGHVGDSRIYRFTKRQGLQQLTIDHEVGQRLIQQGVEPEIAYGRPDAYQLTQALGPRSNEAIAPEVIDLDIEEDTLILLCSDGLSDNRCLETHIISHLLPMLDFSLPLNQSLHKLIDIGNQVNGHDNLTAIALRFKLRSVLNALF